MFTVVITDSVFDSGQLEILMKYSCDFRPLFITSTDIWSASLVVASVTILDTLTFRVFFLTAFSLNGSLILMLNAVINIQCYMFFDIYKVFSVKRKWTPLESVLSN